MGTICSHQGFILLQKTKTKNMGTGVEDWHTSPPERCRFPPFDTSEALPGPIKHH
jgi:hypothetical protein